MMLSVPYKLYALELETDVGYKRPDVVLDILNFVLSKKQA